MLLCTRYGDTSPMIRPANVVLLVLSAILGGIGCQSDSHREVSSSSDEQTNSEARSHTMPPAEPDGDASRPARREHYSLSEFVLEPSLTSQDLIAAIGEPSRVLGSGLSYYVYDLSSGEELWLMFDLGPDAGLDRAFTVSPGEAASDGQQVWPLLQP